MSQTPVDLVVTAGLPYSRRFRLIDGQNVWPSLADFEVRSQVRRYSSSSSPLLADLTPFLTTSLDLNDIVVDLNLTGANTRDLASASGFWDAIISDVGPTDARAVPLAGGRFVVGTTTTAGA